MSKESTGKEFYFPAGVHGSFSYNQYQVLFCLLLFLLNCALSHGQCPLVKKWDKRYGGSQNEWLTSFSETSDRGFILGGTTLSTLSGDLAHLSYGNKDFWIVKTDSMGGIVWEKNYGSPSDDLLTAVKETPDGGFVAVGWTNAATAGGDVSIPGFGNRDYWILKTDSAGNKLWDQRCGGTADDDATAVTITSAGEFIIGGTSASDTSTTKSQPSQGQDDFWIVKISATGNLVWDKRFGGLENDQFYAMGSLPDGSILLGGRSNSGISGDKSEPSRGFYDYWMVKTDSLGVKLWDKRFGGIDPDIFTALSVTKDYGTILAGFTESQSGGDKSQPTKGLMDFWMIKVDSSGNALWDQDYGGSQDDEFIGSVSETSDGGLLIAGTSYSNSGGDKTDNNLSAEQMWIIKTDSAGNKSWDKTIHNIAVSDDEAAYAVQTSDGGYAFANATFADIGADKTETSWGFGDYWIIRYYDSTGIGMPPMANLVVNDTVFCGKQCLDFTDLSTNNPTSWQWFFPGGVPASSTDQDPAGICYNVYGIFDVTLVACNAAGCDSIYLPAFINELQNPPLPVIAQNGNVLVVSGNYTFEWYDASNPGVVLSTDSFYMPTLPGNYFVIACDSIGCCISSAVFNLVGIHENQSDGNNFEIIPVPGTGNVMIITDRLYAGKMEISVYNLAGECIHTILEHHIAGKYSGLLKLGETARGIYFVRISIDDRDVFRKKILVK